MSYDFSVENIRTFIKDCQKHGMTDGQKPDGGITLRAMDEDSH